MRFLCAVLSLAFMSSCATSVPKAENFPQSTQKKALVAQHWSYLAQDAAHRTKLALTKNGASATTPIYVADTFNHEFDKAFKKYMISHLIESGAVVSTVPEGAVEVKYETQVIKHSDKIDPEQIGYKPGYASAGMTGLWILRDVFKGVTDANALGTVALATAFDSYKAFQPDETSIELILSTSIIQNNRYIMLNTDAYYMEKGEEWLFEGCKGNRRRCR